MYDQLSIIPTYRLEKWTAFFAQVLSIVDEARQAKTNPTKKLTRKQLNQIKLHTLKVVGVAIGGGTDSHQDVLLCPICQKRFKRDTEQHQPYCPFAD